MRKIVDLTQVSFTAYCAIHRGWGQAIIIGKMHAKAMKAKAFMKKTEGLKLLADKQEGQEFQFYCRVMLEKEIR